MMETHNMGRGMPGGGQLPLIAFGNQNKSVSGNPSMTFYYKVYKHYTHFSQETITLPMDGPNELMLDTPIRLRAKVNRHADLLTELTFVFRIPDIFSKIVAGDPELKPQFRWIHMLGPMIIDHVGIFVGGAKIQEFPGEWIAMRAQMDMPADKYLKWRSLVGDTPEIHTPEWGIYGKAKNYPYAQGTYPHSIVDASGSPLAPSIPGREIRVPLPFWFSESWGTALPLVALQLHEVEVQITLRTLREIYRLADTLFQSEPLRYGQELENNPEFPTSIDPTTPGDNDNLTLQNDYTSIIDPTGAFSFRSFLTEAGYAVPASDGFSLNAHLEGNYIYLTENERIMFSEKTLQHVVHQVQLFRFPNVVTRSKLDIDSHNLAHRLLFFARRSDAILNRNDYINLSNWKYANQAPFWPVTGTIVSNAGRYLPYGQRDILRSARILCAGNEIFEEKSATYLELQTPFQSTTGGGMSGLMPGAIKPDDVMGPIYHVPFALNASDHVQPSGTLNTSRLREFQLEVNPWPIDPDAPYYYDFTVYVESLNFIKFQNGMAGLAFAV
jgi:hypothetical protein